MVLSLDLDMCELHQRKVLKLNPKTNEMTVFVYLTFSPSCLDHLNEKVIHS